jgi:hypothetical protein
MFAPDCMHQFAPVWQYRRTELTLAYRLLQRGTSGGTAGSSRGNL